MRITLFSALGSHSGVVGCTLKFVMFSVCVCVCVFSKKGIQHQHVTRIKGERPELSGPHLWNSAWGVHSELQFTLGFEVPP